MSVLDLNTAILIDGKWQSAFDGRTYDVVNPATEETIASVSYGGRKECRQAIDAAHRALPGWQKRNAWDRGEILKQIAELLRRRADDIARTLTLEQGKPLSEARGEVMHSAAEFEWYAEEGKRAYGEVIPAA